MKNNLIGKSTIAFLLLTCGLLPLPSAFGAARAVPEVTNSTVAGKALAIVSHIHGSWSQMPGNVVTPLMTPGALIGNGSVGVALGGSPDKLEFYIGRDDFWSVLRGRIMPVGRLQVSIPALSGASTQLRENVAPADITGHFVLGKYTLASRSWASTGKNIFAVQLTNSGSAALPVTTALLDAYGHRDLATLSGNIGQVHWLRVSPEVVNATIGGSRPENGTASGARVRSVEVDRGYLPNLTSHTAAKPLYRWNAADTAGSAGTTNSGPVSLGDIIMPQSRFTVRASLTVDAADSGVTILSALVDHGWMKQTIDPTDPLGNTRGHDIPRTQGAAAGLIVYLSHGRLAANLNGTVVTAGSPLPLHKLVHVAVAYNGQQLVLMADGAKVGATSNFPAAAQVMGPQWQWAAAHPGDSQIPFDGSAPHGVLAMRVLGASPSISGGGMRFDIPAGGKVTILVAVMDNRDTPHFFQAAVTAVRDANSQSVAAMWSQHLAWWKSFWSRSYIEIPDKTIQSWWYGSLYVLASCSRHGNVAPGLWGNWITSTGPAWQGDYTLDYNYQAPFWAAFPTNHVSLADPYDAPLLAWMQRGRGLAKKLHAHGLVYYTHLAPSPGWSADNFRSLDQKSDALFAAVNCVQRWRYTGDAAYARKVWPFLTGVADYWDHELKLVNGRYVDFNDAPDEHLWGPANDTNPATTIGFLRMLYPALIDMSRQLNADPQMRGAWQHILTHLSALPIAPADSVAAIRNAVGSPIPSSEMVILQSEHGMQWVNIARGDRFSPNPPVRMEGSSAGMNSLQVVFPAWNVGLESSPALRQAALNTVRYMPLWYDSNDTSSYYPAAADAGYDPDSILSHLHLLITHIGYHNFAYRIFAGGVENEATVPTTIAAMMLQSYQKDIHVFPDWPKNQDASFGHLLAVGDFLVSSRIADGRVAYVQIVSQRGRPCRLANPWGPNQAVQLRTAGNSPTVLHGAVLNVPTKPGQQLLFTPLPQ